MATSIGSVEVDNAGEATGAGLARELYDARVAGMSAAFPTFDATSLVDDAAVLKAYAVFANADAGAVLAHLTTNAELEISGGGLQRDNTGGNPATIAPASTFTGEGIV